MEVPQWVADKLLIQRLGIEEKQQGRRPEMGSTGKRGLQPKMGKRWPSPFP